MITFQEALEENQAFVVAPDTEREVRGFFTNCRVDKNAVRDGWYAYDIRHGDEGDFCTIEKRVVVNHAGTFLCQQPVQLDTFEDPHDEFLDLGKWDYTFE